MSMVMILKGKDKYYALADNCSYTIQSKIVKTSQVRYRIQKFNNFVILFDGKVSTFQKLVKQFDFNSFPEPLTKGFLLNNFYKDYIDFLVKSGEANVNDDGLFNDSKFGIMIMGKDYAFDISDEYLYEVRTINATGNSLVAFHVHETLKRKVDDETMLKTIMDLSDEYNSNTSYPFIMVTSDDLNHVTSIERDGSTKVEELKEIWG